MASTGSTIVNWFTSEFDDFDLTIALLSSTLFQCHWFANRQCSSIHFPLPYPHPVLIHDSSGSCIYCFAALQAMVSWADTFHGHSLTSVRSDRGGIVIYWTTTTLVSLTILPSISVARCRSPASHLFPSSTSTMIVYERFIWTLPPDNLLHWFTSESDDSNTKIAQLECLHAHPSSSVILLASFGMIPRTTILA